MPGTDFRILLVDDEEHIRESGSRALKRRLHANIVTADLGRDAVELIKKIPFDLLLLDIKLADISGWQVIEEVRQFNSDIKILVVSAWGVLSPEHQQIIDQKTSGYIPKPAFPPKIVQHIAQVFGQDVLINPGDALPDEFKGRREAREIVHAINGAHSTAAMYLSEIAEDMRDGILKDKTPEEILHLALEKMQSAKRMIYEANSYVERIRKL